MQFVKNVVFLGAKEMILRDGSKLVTISFYVDESTVEVNVQATNSAVMDTVSSLSFSDTCTATFMLRRADKYYRLSLVSLA